MRGRKAEKILTKKIAYSRLGFIYARDLDENNVLHNFDSDLDRSTYHMLIITLSSSASKRDVTSSSIIASTPALM